MPDVTDVVKALTELSSQLRTKAHDAGFGKADEDVQFYDGKANAYYDAASMVDAVMIGPAIQAALDEIDRNTPTERK